MMEAEEVPDTYYDVEILRICCKGTNQAAISDYSHLVKYEKKIVKVNDNSKEVNAVAFLNLSAKANNTNDDYLRANDSRIQNDIVQLNAYHVSWVLNSQTRNCMRCNHFFTVASWRHHCRLCGYLVCNRCSCYLVGIYINVMDKKTPKKILLEKMGSRICITCYTNKGGPETSNYFSNPALERGKDPIRRSMSGTGLALTEGTSNPNTPARRSSGTNLAEQVQAQATNTTRGSFSNGSPNPLSRQNSGTNLHASAVHPVNSTNPLAKKTPSPSPASRRASAPATTAVPSVPIAHSSNTPTSRSTAGIAAVGGRSGYTPNAFDPKSIPAARPSEVERLFGAVDGEAEDEIALTASGSANAVHSGQHSYRQDAFQNPIERANRSKSLAAASVSPPPADLSPASVDKETKAKMVQKFQEAKQDEERQYLERVASIKRDPARQVSTNTRENPFVRMDQEKKGGLSPPPIVLAVNRSASKSNNQVVLSPKEAKETKQAKEAKETSEVKEVKETKEQISEAVEEVVQPSVSAVGENEAEEEEQVHAFHEGDVEVAPKTPVAVQNPISGQAPTTGATEASDFSYVSDLTPLDLHTVGTPATGVAKVTFATVHGVWEADSEATLSPLTPLRGEEDIGIAVDSIVEDDETGDGEEMDEETAAKIRALHDMSTMSFAEWAIDSLSPLSERSPAAAGRQSWPSKHGVHFASNGPLEEEEMDQPVDEVAESGVAVDEDNAEAPPREGEEDDDGGFFDSPFAPSAVNFEQVQAAIAEEEERASVAAALAQDMAAEAETETAVEAMD